MRSICGSRITVLGTGDIGTNFARRAKALGAAHIVRRVAAAAGTGTRPMTRMLPQQQLDQVLPETEILVMALPAVADTAGILSRERIALLPREAIVVNVGRGSAIDQDALMEALNAGRIWPEPPWTWWCPEPLPKEHPLWDTRNLLLTPHISGNMSLGYTCDRNRGACSAGIWTTMPPVGPWSTGWTGSGDINSKTTLRPQRGFLVCQKPRRARGLRAASFAGLSCFIR